MKLSNKVTRICACRGICLMTHNNERFDWFKRIISIIYMVSQQLIIQCDVYAVCYLHIKQIAISQERRAIWKTIDGIPLSFQEFFQIRQTEFSFHVHFNNAKKFERSNLREIEAMTIWVDAIAKVLKWAWFPNRKGYGHDKITQIWSW